MSSLPIKLLVVDDQPVTRLLMAEIFRSLDFEVHVAADGFTALAAIRLERPNILLSDLNMPGMSGFELLSVVRRRFPGIYVIATSGAFSGDNTQPGVAADAFYPKATGLAALLSIVSRVPPERLPRLTSLSCFAPIWIHRDGPGPVTIACPDCLRTFPQTVSKAAALIRETVCLFCHTLIHYAIVPSTDDPASPQAFQSKTALPRKPRTPSKHPPSGAHIARD